MRLVPRSLATLGRGAVEPLPAAPQEPFPARTVKIVVPSAPGSTTDTLARIVADQLARNWGKSVIVENVAGGAMNAGAANVARAAPDGETLMVAPPAPLTFNDLLFRDLGYRPTSSCPSRCWRQFPTSWWSATACRPTR